MIVYGDRSRCVSPRAELARIAAALSAATAMRGDGRSDRMLAALIDCGELAQGLADAAFEARKVDEETPAALAAIALTVAVAKLWLQNGGGAPTAELDDLATAELPTLVSCRIPEGYAFYGVHPAAYAAAARRIRWGSPPLVIGLRSIGVSLAATVAAAVAAAAPISLRPHGPPFRRRVSVSNELKRRLAAHPGDFVVVDEGPGLSGSSFAAVATLLTSLGAAPERIAFMPSHAAGPGREASAEVRRTWASVRIEPAAWSPSDAEMAALFADAAGPALTVEDLSGGAWRCGWRGPERPPAWPAQERRKARLVARGGAFVARFAGLGRIGEEKLALARRLHDGGFAPEPLALRNGFLLERWVEGRPPVLVGDERAAFVATVAGYLGLRARLSAGPAEGSDPAALREMALVNAAEAAGPQLRDGVARRLGRLEALAAELPPVRIDGRLHLWEWRRKPDGGFVKTDGLDHAAAHDLVGCQSIAWDLAGAEVEFDLTRAESAELRRSLAMAAGAAPTRAAVEAFSVAYCAFQLGWWTFAVQSSPDADGCAARARRDFYLERLRQLAG